jgi:uncharacterized protein (DUF362 family)
VPDILDTLHSLEAQALPDGGWGYAPGQALHLEPTCLALLALFLEPGRFGETIERGRRALERCAGEDGGYRISNGREEAVWPTALVLFTKAALGESPAALSGPAGRLLALRGRQPENNAAADMHDIDVWLAGWPWAEGNFAWAEPTAWACLALRRAGHGGHPRVAEGLRLLLDRASDDGGINYGNRRVFGRVTEPIPGPTALMLLALQGHAGHPRVAAAVAYLRRQAEAGCDLEHLAWAKLALTQYPDLPGVPESLPALDQRIAAARQERDGTSWLRPAPLRLALAVLALAAGSNEYFRITGREEATEVPDILPCAVRRRSLGQRLGSMVRGWAVKAVGRFRPAPERSAVHIARATDYNADLAGLLGRQYENFRAKVPLAGKRVVLKPNLVEYHRDKVINTHPHMVAAAIDLCRREGAAEVIVAEGPGHWRNVEYLVSASGLGDVLRHYKVPFVDLNHDEPVKMPNFGRLTGLDYLYLARTVATAEVLISLPKLKTHHWAGATLSLKNLFGTLPGICYGWPKNELHWRGIDNSIVDIALTRTPDLAIVDGVVGMEGDGPLNGTAKPLGAIVLGNDLLAVDATCCRLMRLDPERMASLVLGYRKKLGLLHEREIEQLGEPVAGLAQPFETLSHFHELCVGRSA